VVDSKFGRAEQNEFYEELDVKMRCIARRLSDIHVKVEAASSDPAAGTKKARCLSCDKVTLAEGTE